MFVQLEWGRVFVKIRRRHHANQTYEYVDIVESQRVGGRILRRKLGTLGRLDELDPKEIDRLIEHLRKLASPGGLRGVQLGEMEIVAVRDYGVPLVVGQLWSELGLDRLLAASPHSNAGPVRDVLFQEAIFRMVVNRLCDPQSKLGLVDWSDERGNLHRGWQRDVQWAQPDELGYHHYLLSMDRLHPHRQRIEEALFDRTTDLLSLPLRLCFYDLTAGQRYILALRSRQQTEGELALDLAELGRLPRPRDIDAPWQWREVKLIEGLRHVVVYSAFKARHDFEVRARRIRRALPELRQLQERAARD